MMPAPAVDPYCMCGRLCPCPFHGAWARPCDEQLDLFTPKQKRTD